jgi:hypothetical protein
MAASKYAKYINELVIGQGPDIPEGHPNVGTLTNTLEFDKRFCKEATHHIETFIVYKPGASFGCDGASLGQVNGKEFKDFPIKLPVVEMSLFIGTNPEDPTDLGGEVECWIGEGKEAEKYIINKTSCAFFPPGIVHLPIVFRKVDRPFVFVVIVAAAELNAQSVDMLPPTFSLKQ